VRDWCLGAIRTAKPGHTERRHRDNHHHDFHGKFPLSSCSIAVSPEKRHGVN
jgi:hypothetical protein